MPGNSDTEGTPRRAGACARAVAALLFGLAALVSGMAAAQDNCTYFVVGAPLLNVRATPEVRGTIVDVLRSGDVVCVTERKSEGGIEWAFVQNKTGQTDASDEVAGWASLRYLEAATGGQTAPTAQPAAPISPGDAGPALPEPATPPVATAPADPVTGPALPEPAAPSDSGSGLGEATIHFSEPIAEGPWPVRGRSLETLTQSVPLFPPMADLPEAAWKRQCTGCHQWNKERLCAQGKFYVTDPAAMLRIQHPFGGPEKIALRKWAEQGCQ